MELFGIGFAGIMCYQVSARLILLKAPGVTLCILMSKLGTFNPRGFAFLKDMLSWSRHIESQAFTILT